MATEREPRQIGSWTYEPDINRLTYIVTEHYHYRIPLDRMGDAREILNWIAQVNDKTWATPQVVGEFVEALRVMLGGLHQR